MWLSDAYHYLSQDTLNLAMQVSLTASELYKNRFPVRVLHNINKNCKYIYKIDMLTALTWLTTCWNDDLPETFSSCGWHCFDGIPPACQAKKSEHFKREAAQQFKPHNCIKMSSELNVDHEDSLAENEYFKDLMNDIFQKFNLTENHDDADLKPLFELSINQKLDVLAFSRVVLDSLGLVCKEFNRALSTTQHWLTDLKVVGMRQLQICIFKP